MLGASLHLLARPALSGRTVLPTASVSRGVHTLRSTVVPRTTRVSNRLASSVQAPALAHAHVHATPSTERGMKVKTSLEKRCAACQIVRRRGKTFVICKVHPRHKQRTRN